jgi:hypothetical protein
MKHTNILLASWEQPDPEYDMIEIDWPLVQRTIGVDHLEWLLAQPKTGCQLVVERENNELKLFVEFYDNHLEVEYHLRWAQPISQ